MNTEKEIKRRNMFATFKGAYSKKYSNDFSFEEENVYYKFITVVSKYEECGIDLRSYLTEFVNNSKYEKMDSSYNELFSDLDSYLGKLSKTLQVYPWMVNLINLSENLKEEDDFSYLVWINKYFALNNINLDSNAMKCVLVRLSRLSSIIYKDYLSRNLNLIDEIKFLGSIYMIMLQYARLLGIDTNLYINRCDINMAKMKRTKEISDKITTLDNQTISKSSTTHVVEAKKSVFESVNKVKESKPQPNIATNLYALNTNELNAFFRFIKISDPVCKKTLVTMMNPIELETAKKLMDIPDAEKRPVYKKFIDKWTNYGDYLMRMIPAEIFLNPLTYELVSNSIPTNGGSNTEHNKKTKNLYEVFSTYCSGFNMKKLIGSYLETLPKLDYLYIAKHYNLETGNPTGAKYMNSEMEFKIYEIFADLPSYVYDLRKNQRILDDYSRKSFK